MRKESLFCIFLMLTVRLGILNGTRWRIIYLAVGGPGPRRNMSRVSMCDLR